MTEIDPVVRARLAVALDVATLDDAIALARQVGPWIGVAKVGLELFTAEGPSAVTALRGLGFEVFYDAKYHDIPTTVGRASRVAGRMGVRYLNAHAAGGLDMLKAFADNLREGAVEAGHGEPLPLAVTVLTSDADASAFDARLDTAVAAGCAGVVCSALEVGRVRARSPELVAVVPGVRPVGAPTDDQVRSATPGEAAAAGAALVVLGRPVTRSEDPASAAAAIYDDVAGALAGGPLSAG
jgi:orotidine-5'-phosphate decarboxylase